MSHPSPCLQEVIYFDQHDNGGGCMLWLQSPGFRSSDCVNHCTPVPSLHSASYLYQHTRGFLYNKLNRKGFQISLGWTYISFHLIQSSSCQHTPGMCLQEDHSISLALPVLPGQVSSGLGLQHEGCLPLLLILLVELAGANLRLQPSEAQLDLDLKENVKVILEARFVLTLRHWYNNRRLTTLYSFLPLCPLQYFWTTRAAAFFLRNSRLRKARITQTWSRRHIITTSERVFAPYSTWICSLSELSGSKALSHLVPSFSPARGWCRGSPERQQQQNEKTRMNQSILSRLKRRAHL